MSMTMNSAKFGLTALFVRQITSAAKDNRS